MSQLQRNYTMKNKIKDMAFWSGLIKVIFGYVLGESGMISQLF